MEDPVPNSHRLHSSHIQGPSCEALKVMQSMAGILTGFYSPQEASDYFHRMGHMVVLRRSEHLSPAEQSRS